MAVFAQPLGDGQPDTRSAAGDNSGPHAAIQSGGANFSVIKNIPSDYENRTLALDILARF
ncbi:hypothetical protein I552_1983 [Mycobacterium xenopi 3993]|nr:hypothetical protein I552_1983 [Mycobacterium xenopi 3993]